MRIEEMNEDSLSKAPDSELYDLRFRFIQLYEKLKRNKDLETIGGVTRDQFYDRYTILIAEMKKRNLTIATTTDLDIKIFKRAMFGGLDVPKLGDIVLVENYMTVGGSFVKSPADAGDIDIIIRDRDENRDEGVELKVGRLMADETDKTPHFIYSLRGPHSSYIPVFDLVLRAHEQTKRINVRESDKVHKQSPEYFEQLDNWDETLMRDNFAVMKELVDGSVLDIGCGTGRLLKLLMQSGRQVMGVDRNDTAIEFCKRRGLPVLRVDLDTDMLPFESDSYDNVIGIHMLEHLEHPDHAIEAAIRVAKKRVIFLVPLGERYDRSHKQKFEKLEDFERLFSGDWKFRVDQTNNTALAKYSVLAVKKKALTPFGSFDPPKPTMAGITEAFSVDELRNWAKDRELVAEPKLNGIRVVICKAGSRFKIMTENRQDRSSKYPSLSEDIKKLPDDFILDCSMGIERKGQPLPRIKLMTLMSDKPELEADDVIVCTAFDLPYWKMDLHEQPFTERRKKLEAFYNKHLKGSKHFAISRSERIGSLDALQQKFKQFAKLPMSEGVVVKDVDSKWSLDGSESGWAKLKIEAEIKVQVLEKISVKGGNWTYLCGVLKGDSEYTNTKDVDGKELVVLGKTFATKVSAGVGDILTIGVEEVIPQDDKLVWLGPRVLDKDSDRSTPYAANQIVDIAQRANVLQKSAFNCECLECGHVITSDKHCNEIRCPKCGGVMRRLERPGPGSVQKVTLPGIYLVKPHGSLIAEKKKKMIVKIKPLADDYVGHDVYLVEDKQVLGIIELGRPATMDPEKFKNYENEHRITAEEAASWGFDKKKRLYGYRFKIKDIFDPPIGYDPPPGIQTVIREIDIEKQQQEGAAGEAGNIDFDVGDKGTGVLQAHVMGIEEDKIETLKKESNRILVARADPQKLESVLKQAIGEQSIHLDMRLRPSGKDYWEGGEIMVGNISGLGKLKKLNQQNQKLRFGWKVGHKQDGGQVQIVRGPLNWMTAGKRKIEIFEPGEVGAMAKTYAALMNIDSFTWELYLNDKHAKKIRIKGGKYLDGNFLFAFVPVGEGGRVWMISRLADDDHEKEEKPVAKLNSEQKKEYEEETEQIKENRKNATWPHEFKAAKYTHPNGHPRCIICGQEEPEDGVCLEKIRKDSEIMFQILKIDKKKQIAGGIVYEPQVEDTQGDWTDKEEIEKTMYNFMEKYGRDPKRIKVEHEGKIYYFPVLECFQPEQDIKKGDKKIPAGAWWLMIKIPNKNIWTRVESGELTGFSMGGRASEE